MATTDQNVVIGQLEVSGAAASGTPPDIEFTPGSGTVWFLNDPAQLTASVNSLVVTNVGNNNLGTLHILTSLTVMLSILSPGLVVFANPGTVPLQQIAVSVNVEVSGGCQFTGAVGSFNLVASTGHVQCSQITSATNARVNLTAAEGFTVSGSVSGGGGLASLHLFTTGGFDWTISGGISGLHDLSLRGPSGAGTRIESVAGTSGGSPIRIRIFCLFVRLGFGCFYRFCHTDRLFDGSGRYFQTDRQLNRFDRGRSVSWHKHLSNHAHPTFRKVCQCEWTGGAPGSTGIHSFRVCVCVFHSSNAAITCGSVQVVTGTLKIEPLAGVMSLGVVSGPGGLIGGLDLLPLAPPLAKECDVTITSIVNVAAFKVGGATRVRVFITQPGTIELPAILQFVMGAELFLADTTIKAAVFQINSGPGNRLNLTGSASLFTARTNIVQPLTISAPATSYSGAVSLGIVSGGSLTPMLRFEGGALFHAANITHAGMSLVLADGSTLRSSTPGYAGIQVAEIQLMRGARLEFGNISVSSLVNVTGTAIAGTGTGSLNNTIVWYVTKRQLAVASTRCGLNS